MALGKEDKSFDIYRGKLVSIKAINVGFTRIYPGIFKTGISYFSNTETPVFLTLSHLLS